MAQASSKLLNLNSTVLGLLCFFFIFHIRVNNVNYHIVKLLIKHLV